MGLPSDVIFRVVVNDEEQYSIWPDGKELPPGWREEGFTGPKVQCLAHIDSVWTDMRPRSLREYMASLRDRAPEIEREP